MGVASKLSRTLNETRQALTIIGEYYRSFSCQSLNWVACLSPHQLCTYIHIRAADVVTSVPDKITPFENFN